MKHLHLIRTRELDDGTGFLFRTVKDDLVVLSTDKSLYDTFDGRRKRKIGISLCSGCGVRCIYCFTNTMDCFRPLSVNEITEQVDAILNKMIHGCAEETKISFKQMGDPLLNPGNTLESIRMLHRRFPSYSFVVSTSAPDTNQFFFEKLKKLLAQEIRIRLQFSCHTTSDEERGLLSPHLPMMSMERIAAITGNWNGEPATLNFVMLAGFEYSADKLAELFDPKRVFVKVNYLDNNSQLKKHGLTDMDRKEIMKFTQELERKGISFAFRHSNNTGSYN